MATEKADEAGVHRSCLMAQVLEEEGLDELELRHRNRNPIQPSCQFVGFPLACRRPLASQLPLACRRR
jgi:hypothetical protein